MVLLFLAPIIAIGLFKLLKYIKEDEIQTNAYNMMVQRKQCYNCNKIMSDYLWGPFNDETTYGESKNIYESKDVLKISDSGQIYSKSELVNVGSKRSQKIRYRCTNCGFIIHLGLG